MGKDGALHWRGACRKWGVQGGARGRKEGCGVVWGYEKGTTGVNWGAGRQGVGGELSRWLEPPVLLSWFGTRPLPLRYPDLLLLRRAGVHLHLALDPLPS